MDKKITEKLSPFGLKPSDLTKSELNELKKQIEVEEKGGYVIDGVLSRQDVLLRTFKRPKGLK